MKRTIGIVVDSTAGVKFKETLFPDASIVPLTLMIDGEDFVDGTITNELVLKAIDKGKKVRTSQPAPELFVKAFKEQLALGYDYVICLTISKGLSGTINGAKLAAQILNDERVYVIDSQTVGPGIEYLLELIYNMEQKEFPFVQIIKELNKAIEEIYLMFSIEQLGILVSGGRLSKLQAMIGNILKIRPILKFSKGVLTVVKKVRGLDGIFNYLINEIKNLTDLKMSVYAKITYVDRVDRAKQLEHEIYTKLPEVITQISEPISPVVATHLGYSGLGILIAKPID